MVAAPRTQLRTFAASRTQLRTFSLTFPQLADAANVRNSVLVNLHVHNGVPGRRQGILSPVSKG